MKFIDTNMGEDPKILVKARYDRILLAPFIALGALIILVGYGLKKAAPGLLSGFINTSEVNVPEGTFGLIGNFIFIIFLIAGVSYAWVMIVRTTGIELAVTDRLLIGRYGTDAMCVPLEKIENIAIFKNFLGEIFKFGTITVGTPSITLKFPFISEPEKFRDTLLELREKRLS